MARKVVEAAREVVLGAYALLWCAVFVTLWVYASRDPDAHARRKRNQ